MTIVTCSLDGSALDVDNPTIVLEAGEVDMEGNNVVVYRVSFHYSSPTDLVLRAGGMVVVKQKDWHG